jgi:hypothetical protein
VPSETDALDLSQFECTETYEKLIEPLAGEMDNGPEATLEDGQF